MPLLGALSNKETIEALARLNQLRKRLLRECADSPPSSSPRPPRFGDIPRAITRVLADATEPMQVADIHRAIEHKLGRPINLRSVKSCLFKEAKRPKPRFLRTTDGYYRLAGLVGHANDGE